MGWICFPPALVRSQINQGRKKLMVKIINKIHDLIDSLYVSYLRRRILNRKLDDLTDQTFLDRAIAGEKEA